MNDRTRSASAGRAMTKDEVASIVAQADSRRKSFADVLPQHLSFEAFRDSFRIALIRNPKLIDADRGSLFLALQQAATMGLKPDGREGALVIFNDSDEEGQRQVGKKRLVQWMPMIRGLIQLVRNTGEVAGIRAQLVYRGEDIEIVDTDGQLSYKHVRKMDPDFDDSPEMVIGAYAVVQYKDGTWEMASMSRRQIERRRAVSRAKKGPWMGWWDEMARKTVLRHLIKTLPQSSELASLERALDADDAIAGEAEEQPEQQLIEEPVADAPVEAPQEAPQDAPEAVDPLPLFSEDGVQIGALMDARAFAEAFAQRCAVTRDVDSLLDANAAVAGSIEPPDAEIITNAIDAARARLNGPQTNDLDGMWAHEAKEKIGAMPDYKAVLLWAEQPDTRNMMKNLKAHRPDLFAEIQAAADAKKP